MTLSLPCSRFQYRHAMLLPTLSDATQLISFKTVCYDGSFTFIHNTIFKHTYRCRFIHHDLSFLTLFLFTFSICDGHSKFLVKSIKVFSRSFFVVCVEQVCLYSAWRKKLTLFCCTTHLSSRLLSLKDYYFLMPHH